MHDIIIVNYNRQDKILITFKDILVIIKKYWYYLLATLAIFVIAFSLYATFGLPTYYESKTRLYCFAVNEGDNIVEEKDTNRYSDKFAASHAIAMLSSDGFYYELYDMLTEQEKNKKSAVDLKQSILYKLYSNELNIVDISCINTDNKLAQGILIKLNTLIESKLKKLPFENTSFKILVDEYPSLNNIPLTESKTKYYIYGIFFGVIVCCAELIVFGYIAAKKGLIKRAETSKIDEKSDNKVAAN